MQGYDDFLNDDRHAPIPAGRIEKLKLMSPHRRRLVARAVARQAWIDSNGNAEKARTLVKSRLRKRYGYNIVIMFLLGAMIKLAVALIIYWFEQQMFIPPEGDFLAGEPTK